MGVERAAHQPAGLFRQAGSRQSRGNQAQPEAGNGGPAAEAEGKGQAVDRIAWRRQRARWRIHRADLPDEQLSGTWGNADPFRADRAIPAEPDVRVYGALPV